MTVAASRWSYVEENTEATKLDSARIPTGCDFPVQKIGYAVAQRVVRNLSKNRGN